MKRDFIQAGTSQAMGQQGVPWTFPARDFEQRSGITGISCDYEMPGMTMEEVGVYYNDFIIRRRTDRVSEMELHQTRISLNRLLGQIFTLNPTLLRVHWDHQNIAHAEKFIMGICSGFSPDDINYFINTFDPMEKTKKLELYTSMVALRKRMGTPFFWIPAPATIQKIKAHYGLAEWTPSIEEMLDAAIKTREDFPDLQIHVQAYIQRLRAMCQSTGRDVIHPGFGNRPRYLE